MLNPDGPTYKAFVYRCFLDFAGNLPLKRISVQVIESYLVTRHSNKNFNRHRKDLSALFNWVWKRRLMPYNPCHFIEKLGEDKSKRLIPTEEELNKILLAAGEDRPFLIVLYHTLGRVGEIMRLRWDDVNFEKRAITLWTRKRKGGSWEPDNLPMNDTLYDTLKNLWQKRPHPEWVFPNPRTGDRYHSRPKLMRGICRRAGVRYFGFHTIRHFVASLLTDREKVGTPTISKLIRHKSLRTTELYLQKVEDNLLETVRKLDLEKKPAQNPAQSVSEG